MDVSDVQCLIHDNNAMPNLWRQGTCAKFLLLLSVVLWCSNAIYTECEDKAKFVRKKRGEKKLKSEDENKTWRQRQSVRVKRECEEKIRGEKKLKCEDKN